MNYCAAANPWWPPRHERTGPILGYLTKVFALGRLVRGVRSRRPYPEIPTRALLLSLLLGVSSAPAATWTFPSKPSAGAGNI